MVAGLKNLSVSKVILDFFCVPCSNRISADKQIVRLKGDAVSW